MNHLMKYSKFVIAILLLGIMACKRNTSKTIENSNEPEIEKTMTTIEALNENKTNALEDKTPKPTNTDTVKNDIEKRIIVFTPEQTKKTITDEITGYEIRDYILNVTKGQSLKIELVAESGMPYFNLMEPEEEYTAIYNGSINGNQYEDKLKKNGAYIVRVYLMRNAARRNNTGRYNLNISIE